MRAEHKARSSKPTPAPERQRRYRSGHAAEHAAALALRTRGFRILARRFRTPLGEIDLITVKGRRVGFVEVKRRASIAACEDAITPKLRERVRRAASLWLGENARYQQYDVGFDLVFVRPWSWPQVRQDAL